ncbi:alpha-amylase family glycosyl hydrolase [Marinicrinis sediminis]|uniref:Alpha-amylase n=1 Tax=Marinicrinis sediminis TaxID=1652465 RepID=A0ABW5R8R5_9BACL
MKRSTTSMRSLKRLLFFTMLTLILVLGACSNNDNAKNESSSKTENEAVHENEKADNGGNDAVTVEVDEQPGTVYYEIFVRSFYDSDGDGIGDLQGIIQKLDYLNDGNPDTDSDLGIGGIWLMPINPSPSYHGYDVTDYYDINPQYGTKEDFKELLDEAHKRGIKIIMDLVVNHSSSEHPWFIEANQNVDSTYRDWYVWGDDSETGFSATGGPAWHRGTEGKYLGTFWSGMPDLNFDNEEVRKEMIQIGKHWLEFGVDGFRIDAAKHIYEDLQSHVNDESIVEKNIAWWKEFQAGMKEAKPDVYLLGEIYDSAAVKSVPYAAAFDSTFHFGLAEKMLTMAEKESAQSLTTMLEKIYKLFNDTSNGQFIDAPFLTNHDQNRTMSVLRNDVNHAKTAASLLLTMPGNPFIYYGEEIGMLGMKPDEQIREPMIWYTDGAIETGQTTWERWISNRDDLPSVEEQSADPASLLSHYRNLIHVRNASAALSDGMIGSLGVETESDAIVSYARLTNEEQAGVLINLGPEPVQVTLDADESYEEVLYASDEAASIDEGSITVPAYGIVILK